MRRAMLAAACMLVGTCVASSAAVSEGTIEVRGQSTGGFGTSLVKGAKASFGFDVIGGYFLMPELEIIGELSAVKAGDADAAFTLLGGVDYLFEGIDDQWVPYVGGGIGIKKPNAEGKTGGAGLVHGGVRYFIVDTVSANVEGKYDFDFSDIGKGTISLMVGLSVYFGM